MSRRPRAARVVTRPVAVPWQQTLNQALRHHQAGQFEAASARYRDVLRAMPNQPDALHLLGVLALQQGQPAEAVPLIQRAVAARCDSAVYYGNLGVALQSLGRAEEARQSLERAVALDPSHVDALFNLGVTLQRLGEHAAAAERYRAVLGLAPGHLDARFNLGNALQTLGEYDEAIACYRRVLTLAPPTAATLSSLAVALAASDRPDEALPVFEQAAGLAPSDPSLLLNLAVALHQQERFEGAIAAYRRVLALQPDHHEAQQSLGRALQAADHLDESVACFEWTVQQAPDDASAHLDLARALRQQRRCQDALPSARRACELAPEDTVALRLLGAVLRDLGQYEDATAVVKHALDLDPTLIEACQDLGSLLMDQAQPDAALPWIERVAEARPNDWASWASLGIALDLRGEPDRAVEAYGRSLAIERRPGIQVRQATVLPIVQRSTEAMLGWRARWTREVARLQASGLRLTDPTQHLGRVNFYMAYHGLDDRPCQEQLARFYLDACPSLGWVAPHCRGGAWSPPGARFGGRIRVGIISRFLSRHTIGKLMHGIVGRLDRSRFEVIVFQLGKADDEARRIAGLADRAVRLGGDLASMRAEVAAAELDALFYADIGMDPTTYFLAFSRLAPVQCVTWGHPVTTGLPTIDAYLSADVIEPPGAEASYTERLVRLDRLPTWYEAPTVPDQPAGRASLGLPEDATLYVCPQTLFKLHPDFDPVVAQILRRDPRGRLVLIEGPSEVWGRVLRERMAATAPDVADRVLLSPRLSEAGFLDLVRNADVVVDPFHFGGGNTTYEILAMGTPIVTWPADFMRGRITAGAYRQMGVDGPVAATPAEYVDLAVNLANDPAASARLSEQIRAAHGGLYEGDGAIAAIERYLEDAVAEAADARRA